MVEGIKLCIHPHVYPSERFRTTTFVLKNIKERVKNKRICDMGCGPGIVGLYAIANCATSVVQVDINPFAIKNANENIMLNGFQDKNIKTIQSDCFDEIQGQLFDVVIWNIPYHNDSIQISDPLERAFYDPLFASTGKFLSQLPEFTGTSTEVYIAFSSKGDFLQLQKLFETSGFNWKIWKITNEDQEYDNRIYSLKYSGRGH